MDRIKESIINNNITLIITTPFAKSLLITNILNELSIKDNKKTVLFSFGIRSEYYFKKLVSFLSGINIRLINKYLYPYATLSKNNKDRIESNNFISTIEKIQSSNIIMIDENKFTYKDYMNYILNYNDADNIIIDNFNSILSNEFYSIEELFKIINKKNNKHYVFLIPDKNNEQDKIINKFSKYINNFILVNGNNYLDYRDITIIINNKLKEQKLNIKFDKLNRIINDKESIWIKNI